MTEIALITGGLGYLGGRIARTLSGREDLCLRLGSRQTSVARPTWLRNGNVLPLDLEVEGTLKTACKGVKYVVHLAAMNEIDSAMNPHLALIVNGLGTFNLLRAAERAGVERFIYFSTAHVYGSPLIGKMSEQTLSRPLHPYAISHRVAEDFVLASHVKQSLIGIVLRLSNGLGTPVRAEVNRWTLISNDLCRQAVTTKKLALHSAGLQYRDFIPLEDVGRAVAHFLNLPSSNCGDGLFNLGGECSLRIIDLAERIASRCGEILGFTPSIIRPEPKRDEVSEPLEYRIDKLKATNFSLKGSIDKEIDETLMFCREAFSKAIC